MAREAWKVTARSRSSLNTVFTRYFSDDCKSTVFKWKLLGSLEKLNNVPEVRQLCSEN